MTVSKVQIKTIIETVNYNPTRKLNEHRISDLDILYGITTYL